MDKLQFLVLSRVWETTKRAINMMLYKETAWYYIYYTKDEQFIWIRKCA